MRKYYVVEKTKSIQITVKKPLRKSPQHMSFKTKTAARDFVRKLEAIDRSVI